MLSLLPPTLVRCFDSKNIKFIQPYCCNPLHTKVATFSGGEERQGPGGRGNRKGGNEGMMEAEQGGKEH